MTDKTTAPAGTQDAYGRIPPGRPRKRRRVFMWAFLAVQLVFVALIVAYATESTGPSREDIVNACFFHKWYPLFQSQQDCVTHFGGLLNTAGHAGQGIGIILVIVAWVATDIILGIGRLVVVTSRRRITP